MTTVYNGTRPKLTIDRAAGITNYCLGFVKDGNYFVPVSCLLEDIRTLGNCASQILAIMSKKAVKKKQIYKEIRYVAKGVSLNKLSVPSKLNTLMSLDNYYEKYPNISK